MGYTIKIGNAKPEFSKDDGELWARWTVGGESSDQAPTFPHDEMTGNTNIRSPSYTGWSDFCEACGLHDMFLERWEGLMGEHPGCKMLQKEHLLQVQAALEKWRRTAAKPPGFEGWPKYNEETGQHETPDKGKYDPILARLIWLEFWIKWALDNCDTPAIENS